MTRKHTHETCRAEAAKYKNRWAYFKGDCSSYKYARRHGLLDDVCAHMGPKLTGGRRKRKHTLETCRVAAAKYETRTAYAHAEPSSYQRARIEGWLDEICRHMDDPQGRGFPQ